MLAIIGGTGLYDLPHFKVLEEREIGTPFGRPSAPLLFGEYDGQKVVFLPRHGKRHEFLPHEINYRANTWALKSVGVYRIISISAVGSLQEELAPGDFVIPSQYFDWVKDGRIKTFFGDGLVAHVAMANPSCLTLTRIIADAAHKLNINIHVEKTYVGVEGPRFGTKAESDFLKDVVKCDIVGMTNIPEVFLAREAQICYCTIAIVTDYDSWQDDHKRHVTAVDVIEQYKKSLDKIMELLDEILATSLPPIDHDYRKSLENAVLTPIDNLTPEKKQLYDMLMT
ncbi:MAG: hypothetical protein AMJ43_01060 [Coxiella sp. DG_40]|nr:MAG: hypothetical protein AMJ43_01060 [Coxiella sp. DG_40]